MTGQKEESLRTELKQLEETVADLRAQTGVEAFELRARLRALESRVEELAGTSSSTAPPQTARRKRPKAGRAAPENGS